MAKDKFKSDAEDFLSVLHRYAPKEIKKRPKFLLNKPSQFITGDATSSPGLKVRKNNFSDTAPELEVFTISNRLQQKKLIEFQNSVDRSMMSNKFKNSYPEYQQILERFSRSRIFAEKRYGRKSASGAGSLECSCGNSGMASGSRRVAMSSAPGSNRVN